MMLTQIAEVAVEFFHTLFVRLGAFALQALVKLKAITVSQDPGVGTLGDKQQHVNIALPFFVCAPHA